MSYESVRSTLKVLLPLPLRRVLRGGLHYTQRVGRWPIILWQVRGVTWGDQATLLRSAFAAPFVSLRDLMSWQDPRLLDDALVDVEGVGRFALRRHSDDLWHVLPWREQAIFDTIRANLGPGEVFVDAGANIGVYSILASRLVGDSGRVVAVEMMPDTADRLEHHVALNELKNVTIVRGALSDEPDQVVTATVQAGKYGQATIATDSDRYGVGTRVEVKTKTLDGVCDGIASVKLMKMDLEGNETRALRGAELLLSRVRGLIYESWSWKRSEADTIDSSLSERGFRLNRIDGNNVFAVREAGQ